MMKFIKRLLCRHENIVMHKTKMGWVCMDCGKTEAYVLDIFNECEMLVELDDIYEKRRQL